MRNEIRFVCLFVNVIVVVVVFSLMHQKSFLEELWGDIFGDNN